MYTFTKLNDRRVPKRYEHGIWISKGVRWPPSLNL